MAVQESRLLITIDARNAEQRARELSRELQNITDGGNRATQQTGALSNSLKSLAGYMAGIVTVGTAINKMDAYTNLQNRLKLVTDSQESLNKATQDTFKIAQATAQEWSSVVQVYQRFSDNAKTLNLNMQQTASLTETVAKSIAISGASASGADAALMQFGQALASGVLRGEEFNSIAEQAPALLKAIANGLNTNIGQLRAMAAEGKLTGDVVVKSLEAAKVSVDELFSKTDFTIANSFTQLNNAVTLFVGEAGKGSGAASALSESISFLAQNLSTIADIAFVGGVALLTKTIIAQTVSIYGSITASSARRAADLASLQTQANLARLEVSRTRQIAALAATEVNLARLEFNSALTRTERAAATMRLTQAEIALALAEKQKTAATIADTAAQNANNAARSRGALILGAIGGPIGAITIGVAALAAGYVYLKNRTAEANAKLEEQGQVAEKTNEELLKLSGNDKKNAISDLTTAFKSQNAELAKSKEAVDAVLFAIRASSVENEKARKVTEDARSGLISYNKAIELLNNMNISPELYEMLKKQANQYDENSLKAGKSQKVLSILGIEFTLTGNKAQDSENKIKGNTGALDDNARAAIQASKAQQEYNKSLGDRAYDAAYVKTLREKYGYTKELAEETLKLQIAEKGRTSKGVAQKDIDRVGGVLKLESAVKSLDETERKRQSNLSKASNNTQKDAERAQKESNQLAKEQYDLREGIAYEFADRTMQIEMDLQKKIADIQKANFSPQDTAGYIANARARAESEKEIFVAQLEYELNEFNLSEDAKLKKKYEINKLMIESNLDLSNENRDIALRLTEKQYQQELAYIELAKEQRIFAARESMLVEVDAVRERYALELKEIAKIKDAKERAAILEAKNTAYINLGVPNGGARLNSVQGRSDGFGMSQTDTLNAEYIKQNEEMNLRYAQQQEAAQNNAMALLAIEQEYLLAKGRLNTEYDEKLVVSREIDHKNQLQYYGNMLAITQSTFGQMTSLVKDSQGENSSAYKTMFAMQQAMAIASALVSTHLAAAQVMADPTALTLAQKTTYSSLILASGYANAGMIAAQTIAGFKTGGYTGSGGTSQVAGVVHGQEYVLNAEATKRVGRGTLDALNNGGTLGDGDEININVILNISNDGSSTTRVEGQAKEKELASVIANAVRAIIIKEKRQGGLLS